MFNLLFKELLPLFWNQTICQRIQLVITDGCTSEYVSFIQNCGIDKSFPNEVHGLCYFYLAIQGFQIHVHPNILKAGRFKVSSVETISIVKLWVKQCF